MNKYVDKDYFKKINFFKLPKELFKNKKYKHISLGAKILYSFLLERINLSFKNNWKDENNNYYIISTREEIIDFLGISKQTCSNLFKELRKINLIEEKKQGISQPNLIYILPIEVENLDAYNLDLSKSKNYTSRGLKNRLVEVENLDAIKTNNIKTNNNKTDYNKKENNNIINNIITKESELIKFYDKVFLKKKDYNNLLKDFGEEIINKYIMKINNYLLANPKKKYSNFNLAIRNWLKKDYITNNKKIEIINKIKEIWNHKTNNILDKITIITEKRKSNINNLIQKFKLNEDNFNEIVDKIINDDFYIGKKTNWKATFDWIINEDNFVKILEKNIKYKNNIDKKNNNVIKLEEPNEEIDEELKRILELTGNIRKINI